MSSRLCEGSCELVPTELKRLKIDRVDLVPEGANSAAFVTLYKGKEMKSMDATEILSKLKPEHAAVIQAELDSLKKAKEEAEQACEEAKKACEAAAAQTQSGNPDDEDTKKANGGQSQAKPDNTLSAKAAEGTTSFDEDETLTKGLDPQVVAFIDQLKKQKAAAEEVAKEAIAKERHANAVAKAAELKALPIEESQLVAFIEKSNDETVDLLSAIAKGIESTVLSEEGSNTSQTFTKSSSAAWEKIEKEAQRLASERGVTVAKATGMVISEQPELYKEYLEGGAN